MENSERIARESRDRMMVRVNTRLREFANRLGAEIDNDALCLATSEAAALIVDYDCLSVIDRNEAYRTAIAAVWHHHESTGIKLEFCGAGLSVAPCVDCPQCGKDHP